VSIAFANALTSFGGGRDSQRVRPSGTGERRRGRSKLWRPERRVGRAGADVTGVLRWRDEKRLGLTNWRSGKEPLVRFVHAEIGHIKMLRHAG
jgi:hypothetical protein